MVFQTLPGMTLVAFIITVSVHATEPAGLKMKPLSPIDRLLPGSITGHSKHSFGTDCNYCHHHPQNRLNNWVRTFNWNCLILYLKLPE